MAGGGAFVGPGRQQSFALQVGKWADKAKGRADLVTRKVVIEMVKSVVLKSPVGNPDTWADPSGAPPGYVGGRFRANWNVSYGKPVQTTSDATDKSGAGAIARGTAVGMSFPMGQTVWIANALPYATRLEYGWSKQAPAGMIRLTAAEFQGLVATLAGQVNR